MRVFPRNLTHRFAILAHPFFFLTSSFAQASPWDRESRDCRVQLAKATDMDRIGHCMLLWVSYSSQDGLSSKERRSFAAAFNRLHQASGELSFTNACTSP